MFIKTKVTDMLLELVSLFKPSKPFSVDKNISKSFHEEEIFWIMNQNENKDEEEENENNNDNNIEEIEDSLDDE